ncbi:hypothetical protein HYH03_011938 [Edaphochlamys debaryana]|uniref:Guanylate cyclase domain-containing protein n=1 Tax=Edaphochlamys debaryana TaxID=47281 RepID=A0A835XZ03_9CHLO|nr:hypothetical protein HYH03_011938 [Edaphochlamys debaryana]|eukprot:KAG2489485.1 hypothetical protein HYH03_011938 [Edaphochlamys debaryana]
MRHRTVGDYIQNWVEVWPTPDNPGPNDWWMLGSEVFGEDLDHGAFLDLTRLLTADPGFALSDIPVQFRDAGSSAYAGRYTAMPLFLTTFNLLYRRDIFEQYNLSVPATWDDALDIADKYGRGALGPGQPDMGFCFESNPACGYAQAMIVYILASMVQLKGASDGAYFDPVTMDPLYTSPAMREALRIYGALRSHSRASHNSSSMSGRQRVAGTPGSAVVMDRSTGRMGPCTREACPSAKEESDPRTGGSRLVNKVVPVDGLAFGINRFSPPHRQGAAYAMLSAFTAPAEHFRAALLPFTEVSPIRYRELDAREWIIAGYNPADLDDFLAQHRISFDSENVYYELRIPGTFQTYTLVERVLRRYNANNYTYEELMAWANEGTDLIFASLGGRDRLRPLYQGSIGYKPPPPPPAPSSGGSSSAPLLIAVLVPSLVSLVLLGGALWAYLRCARLRDERRARLSAAPGAGPGTTLIVTDIQDSTCLWESLPASVMDVALKTHHRVIRQLLIQHAGYESATEGDSFILAFAKPDRALAFALSAQDALLAAEWPGELLDSAHAPTLVVTHDTTACAAAQLSIAGPALWKEHVKPRMSVDLAPSGRVLRPPRPGLPVPSLPPLAGSTGTASRPVLSALDPRPGHVHYSGPYLVLQGGKCVLKEGQAPVDVLCAFSSALLPGRGHMEGLRCRGRCKPPLGLMAVALAQVHTSPGSFQAAFTSPCRSPGLADGPPGGPGPAVTGRPCLSCSALASREATSGNMSVDTDSTTREAAVLTRAVAMARLSILVVRGGLDVGVLPATMGPTGEVAYAGTALKRATCLAANAAWHKILVSLELCGACWESKEGAAPLDLLAQPVPGTLPSASKNESSKAQDVVFGPGLRLVKHKGAVLEACAVRRQGAAAVATPNATGTPLARDASSGSSPMCQQQSPALPSPLPEPSCAPASGPEPAAAPTPAEAHVSMWLRPSMEDRLRSAPSLKRVLGSLDE